MHYCHFTSPIRRYPDVLVHRILAQCLAEDIKIDKLLEKRCKHSSEMERKAMDAERAGNKYKQVEYMQQFIGETFEAVVSGVAHFGFWAETVEAKCEGLISIHNLRAKDFRHSESEYALIGMQSGRRIRIGDRVTHPGSGRQPRQTPAGLRPGGSRLGRRRRQTPRLNAEALKCPGKACAQKAWRRRTEAKTKERRQEQGGSRGRKPAADAKPAARKKKK